MGSGRTWADLLKGPWDAGSVGPGSAGEFPRGLLCRDLPPCYHGGYVDRDGAMVFRRFGQDLPDRAGPSILAARNPSLQIEINYSEEYRCA